MAINIRKSAEFTFGLSGSSIGFISLQTRMKMMCLISILLLALLGSCSGKYTPNILTIPFSRELTPPEPDYKELSNWAVLPDKEDNADRVPRCKGCKDEQPNAEVDVFFIFIQPFTLIQLQKATNGMQMLQMKSSMQRLMVQPYCIRQACLMVRKNICTQVQGSASFGLLYQGEKGCQSGF